MEVWRTVPVKLDVTESDADLLRDTVDQFRDAADYVVRHARDDDGYVINTGTLNTSGFEPVPDSVRVGVHGESPTL